MLFIFQHLCQLYICGSLRQLFFYIGVYYVLFHCLNTNILFYMEKSGGQSSNLYLNVVHFSTLVLIRHLWQLKTVFFCIGVDYVLFHRLNTNIYFYLRDIWWSKVVIYILMLFIFYYQC